MKAPAEVVFLRPGAEAIAAEIRSTGEVACPKRLQARIARDRCIQLQHGRCGCSCPLGAIVKTVGAMERLEDAIAEERLAAARLGYAPATEKRTWTLTCQSRKCGQPFVVERGYHRKPRYCCDEHARDERRARAADRAARAAEG